MIDIIAELGSNPVDYEWNTERFCKFVAQAGATHIKIQVYKSEHFPAPYQDEKRRLEFPRHRIREFADNAHRFGLKAGASVFDEEAVEICAAEMDFLKLAAREQDNWKLAGMVADTGKSYFRSISNISLFRSVLFIDREGYWQGEKNVSNRKTLYAIQKYPAPMTLSVFHLLRYRKFISNKHGVGDKWGWSSHTTGALDCILAARLGASAIEKHLALSRSDVEAGHSLNPVKFLKMASKIRMVEK